MASSHLCSLWSLKHLWILSHQYLLLGIPQCRWFLYAASQTLAGRPSCSWRDWSSFFTWLYLQSTGQSTDLLPLNFYSSPKKCQAVADIVGRRSDFSLQKLPSCSWGDWRFRSSFATLPIGHSRYLWSTVSTTEFSRQRMPSCICWDWCSWSSLPLELIVINCLYLNFSRQVFKLAWSQLVRLMLVNSFATWTRRALELSVIDCLYLTFAGKLSSLRGCSWWDWCLWSALLLELSVIDCST